MNTFGMVGIVTSVNPSNTIARSTRRYIKYISSSIRTRVNSSNYAESDHVYTMYSSSS